MEKEGKGEGREQMFSIFQVSKGWQLTPQSVQDITSLAFLAAAAMHTPHRVWPHLSRNGSLFACRESPFFPCKMYMYMLVTIILSCFTGSAEKKNLATICARFLPPGCHLGSSALTPVLCTPTERTAAFRQQLPSNTPLRAGLSALPIDAHQ